MSVGINISTGSSEAKYTGRVGESSAELVRHGTQRGHLGPAFPLALPGQRWAHKGPFRRRGFREQQTGWGPGKGWSTSPLGQPW